MKDRDIRLERGARLSPKVTAKDGVVVVDRPGVSVEILSVAAAVAVAHRLLDAAAQAAGQAAVEEDAKRRRLN